MTCANCAYWLINKELPRLIRSGGFCTLLGKEKRMFNTCWGWKHCSPGQAEWRVKVGLI